MAGGRTGCRAADDVDEVARAAVALTALRLVGVAGYEGGAWATRSRRAAYAPSRDYLTELRTAVLRLADCSRPTTSWSPRAAAHTSTRSPTILDGVAEGLAVARCCAAAAT